MGNLKSFNEDGKFEFANYKYWCDCGDIYHALSLDIDSVDETVFISIMNNRNLSIWQRILLAFSVLFNKETNLVDILINTSNQKEIGELLLENYRRITNENKKTLGS